VSAFDGNPATFWGPGFDARAQVGAWMQANLTHPITFDHLNLEVLADKEHSVPTEIRITTNEGGNVLVHLPAIHDVDKPGAVAKIPVSFKPVTGSVLRFTVEAVRQETTVNWYSEQPIVLPFAISEIGVPGLHFTPENTSAQIPSVCRGDLATVDGQPLWLKVSGTVGTAEKLGDLQISGCGPDAHGIKLGPGRHQVVTAWGKLTGLDVNRLLFDSAAGGAAEPLLPSGNVRPVPGTLADNGVPALAAPAVHLDASTSTTARLTVTGATKPFWLVLGQSVNAGWQADIAGGAALGRSTLIDGYANGWYVVPQRSSFVVDLTWTPQEEVDIALVVSAVAIFACLLLAFVPWRRRRSRSEVGVGVGVVVGVAVGDNDVGDTLVGVAPAAWFAGAPAATLGAPWLASGRPAGILATVTIAIVASGLSAVAVPPRWALLTAVGVAVATLVCSRFGGLRLVLTASAVAGATAAGIITIVGQMANHYPPSDAWPPHFEAASVVTLVAFMALAADAMVELARNRSARRLGMVSEPAVDESVGALSDALSDAVPDDAPPSSSR
jgi:arabinofuranan 3-O-arabinosyltransferase